ncbi:hypothetical protein M446_1669 [Methylobacterium sp. 4-46]|uniref:hypothetical protein n=1 Tax=unclassified Methylobacterium TaxID=2615210 RepID=UPI000165C635|nr:MULTISPECIES: hypothetical protein [Methylobacterium]ACA16162.1 hypothetical protein M446_1669 [Methylobacterium sp. 4-46]WFT81871.1 hypothetical protein QA634_08440 [Methylobacterium nodulans]
MWEAEVIGGAEDAQGLIWVRAPRDFPNGLDELVGGPVTVGGVARSILDVVEPEDGGMVRKGDRLGLILDPA